MAPKDKLGAGNVTILLDGEAVTLRPTLRAAQTISRQSGGIIEAISSVAKFDLDAMVSVVALGLGEDDVKAVADKVWRTGMSDLVGPVTRYLSILANGGRPPEANGGEEEADPQKG